MLSLQVVFMVISVAMLVSGIVALLVYAINFDVPDWLCGLGAILIIVGFAILLFSAIGMTEETAFVREGDVAYTKKIVASNAGVAESGGGKFFLGTGTFVIGSSNVYRLYVVGEDGAITQLEIPSDKTRIYYCEDGEEPCLQFINCVYCTRKQFLWQSQEEEFEKIDRYILKVPEDSIADFSF